METSNSIQSSKSLKGDYSYFMNSLKKSMCEQFSNVSNRIKYDDPIVELIILMILLVMGVMIIVNYMY
jgi:hypothetical protein